MLSIAEWTDRALALSSPMKLTSSASFSPSIRISLRLKIHQAQAKNFCRVLDIRVTKIMEANLAKPILLDEPREMLRCIVRTQKFSALVNADVVEVVPAVTFFEESPIHLLLLFLLQQDDSYCWNQR